MEGVVAPIWVMTSADLISMVDALCARFDAAYIKSPIAVVM